MTTERRPAASAQPARRLGWSAREWQLYLTTVLAAAYVLVWSALAVRVREPADALPRPGAPGKTRPLDARVVWLGDLPPAMRPSLQLPAGWTVATPDASPESSPVVPATPRRAVRIRTRSS
jgi:hypothetical protein